MARSGDGISGAVEQQGLGRTAPGSTPHGRREPARSLAQPTTPWANAASSIRANRSLAPGARRVSSSAGLAANTLRAVAACGSAGSSRASCWLNVASAASGARPRSAASASSCSLERQGTCSCGAGVPHRTVRSMRSGRRAASASATQPPAAHPTRPTRPVSVWSGTASGSTRISRAPAQAQRCPAGRQHSDSTTGLPAPAPGGSCPPRPGPSASPGTLHRLVRALLPGRDAGAR